MLKRVIALIVVFTFIVLLLPTFSGIALAATQTKLTYFVELDSKVAVSYTSYDQIAAYQMLMKKFNVKIDFRHPPSGGTGAQDQFNLMVASRQLTDIIEWNWLDNYAGGPTKAMQDKVILRLNDYIDKYAPNFSKYLKSHPEVQKMITTDDGDIYCIPVLKEDKINLAYYGAQIRKDWLEKVGLSVPETVDEWYKMLKAFKTKDPNGNNKQDEKPFTIIRSGATVRSALDYSGFLIGAWNITPNFYVDKGKVKYGPLQPQFKEFIATLQKWWKDGLIDPNILTMQDAKPIKADIQNDVVGSWLGLLSGDMGGFLNLKYGKSSFDIVAAKNPVLKIGQKPIIGQNEYYFNKRGAAITTACKNIPLALKILDWGFSKEGYMAFNFGVQGKSYVMKDGKPVYTDEIMKNPKGLDAATALARYARASISGPFVQSKEYIIQIQMMWPQQKDAVDKWSVPDNSMRLSPFISYTDVEAKKVANIENNINTFYDETLLKMMTGKYTNIDAFVKTLKRMGIDELTKIKQDAYQRYLKRK